MPKKGILPLEGFKMLDKVFLKTTKQKISLGFL